MMNEVYYLIVFIISALILWFIINKNYLHVNKMVKKTKTDVDNCMRDVEKLKSDVKKFGDIIITIDKRIVQIEKKVK